MDNKRSYVTVEADIAQKLKIKAAVENTSITSLVRRALVETYPELGENNGKAVK